MSTCMKHMRRLNAWTVIWYITLNLLFRYISGANMAIAIYIVSVHNALIPQFKGDNMRNIVYSRFFIFGWNTAIVIFGNHLALVLSALTFLFVYHFDFQ